VTLTSKPAVRKDIVTGSKRIVIKLGTAVLMNDQGGIALSRFYSFVEGIAQLIKSGKEVLLVTSGAVGLGARALGFTSKPKLLPQKQACAAVGQGRLMALYSDAFEKMDVVAAQILLTEEDFSNRQRYLNLRSTINELIEHHVLPIFNENDTVSTAEIEMLKEGGEVKVNFGDNDKLSSLVASKIEADLLIILTDVEGLYTADPRSGPDAKLIAVVEHFTPEIEGLGESKAASDKPGRGGIKTKLAAAKVATQSGCAAIIASGKTENAIGRIFAGEELGTLFLPHAGLSGKQRWIAFATTIKASLVVNEGAKAALTQRKASLLPAGVVAVKGHFERGDVVSVEDEDGKDFARGIVNYSSDEAKKVSGLHSGAIDELIVSRNYDALITRDNIVFLDNLKD
jgi:glutamate 5-kinase